MCCCLEEPPQVSGPQRLKEFITATRPARTSACFCGPLPTRGPTDTFWHYPPSLFFSVTVLNEIKHCWELSSQAKTESRPGQYCPMRPDTFRFKDPFWEPGLETAEFWLTWVTADKHRCLGMKMPGCELGGGLCCREAYEGAEDLVTRGNTLSSDFPINQAHS